MYKSKTLCVIVPCYQEEKQLGKVISTMPAFVDTIVVVDDASKDRTSEVALEWKQKDSRVHLIRHEVNQGVGGAMATGYKWARDNNFDLAAIMAGDAQMEPSELASLCDPVIDDGVNYTKANRIIYPGYFRIAPRKRMIGNSILSFLTKIASGYWHISDSQAGYTVCDKRVLQAIDWDKLFKRYGVPNDILVKLNVEDLRVRDVMSKPLYGVGEESKLQVSKVILPISRLLFKSFWKRLFEKYVVRDFHPLILYYLLGVIMTLASVGLFIRMIWLWIADGFAPPMTSMALFFAFTTAIQTFFFAMWLDRDLNRDLK